MCMCVYMRVEMRGMVTPLTWWPEDRDGELLASAGDDLTVRIFDMPDIKFRWA